MYPTRAEREYRRIMLNQQKEMVMETVRHKDTKSIHGSFSALDKIQAELDVLDKIERLDFMVKA